METVWEPSQSGARRHPWCLHHQRYDKLSEVSALHIIPPCSSPAELHVTAFCQILDSGVFSSSLRGLGANPAPGIQRQQNITYHIFKAEEVGGARALGPAPQICWRKPAFGHLLFQCQAVGA